MPTQYSGESPLGIVLARLNDPRQHGDEWLACCPAHDDHNPSLSVKAADDGRVLLICRSNGCETKDIVNAIGLEVRDLFWKSDSPIKPSTRELSGAQKRVPDKPKGPTFPTPEAAIQSAEKNLGPSSNVWKYQDREAKPVGYVARWDMPDDKKTFRPVSRRDDGWGLEAMPEPRPLYRLPELLDAEMVFITEGEKAADAVVTLGLIGTTSAGGSGAPEKTDWSPLAGKHLVLLPDNDQPGTAYAHWVYRHLLTLEPLPTITIVELPGLREKGDIVDWIESRDSQSYEELCESLLEMVTKSQVELVSGHTMAHLASSANSGDCVNSVYASEDWPEPISLGTDPVADFPIDAIPESARTYLQQLAEFTQTPIDLAAGMFLVTTAIAVQKKFVVEPSCGWFEQLSLYVVSAMESANRKSAVVSEIARPIRDYETELAKQIAPAIRASRSAHEVRSKQRVRLVDDAAKANGPERDAILRDIELLDEEIAENPVLLEPSILVDDITPENLATKMANNGGRMGVLTPEGDLFEIMAGRYSKGPNIGIFLKAHNGDEVRVDRGNRPSEHIKCPALSMGFCVQPAILHGLQQQKSFRGKGLTARLLFQLPESLLGRRKTSPDEVDPAVQSRYAQLMQVLVSRKAREEDGEFVPDVLRLSVDASAIFSRFREEIETCLGDFGSLATLKDWGGKLPGAVARIAGLLHLIENANETEMPSLIGSKTISSAIKIGRYFVSHANAAFHVMGKDESMALAEHILHTIRHHGMTTFSKRDLYQNVRRRVDKPEDLSPPLKILVDHNFIREIPQPAGSKPGRPKSPVYQVNPKFGEGKR